MSDSVGKVCYLMRGLPSCGKSTLAKILKGDSGIVCETDDYYFSQLGDPDTYDYDPSLHLSAEAWCFDRFRAALKEGVTPIVIDRGNCLSLESKAYAMLARANGYELQLKEPETPWWQEIKVLLKYKKYNLPVLKRWALSLASMNRSTHRVPPQTIWRWMLSWQSKITINDIIEYIPSKPDDASKQSKPQFMDVNEENLEQGLDFYKVDQFKYIGDSLGLELDATDRDTLSSNTASEDDLDLDTLISGHEGWKLVDAEMQEES